MRNTQHTGQTQDKNILVWLPSPMGDAILCTPALRAIRQHFESAQIASFAKPVVRRILSPDSFTDLWLQQQNSNPFAIANTLKKHRFTHAVLFKNSFASALATFMARIPSRIGYAREGRGLLLTNRLYPPRLPNGKFKPISMIDYYLAIAHWLGADTTDRNLELSTDPQSEEKLKATLPQVVNSSRPVAVLVPGGAFGPSKCWPSQRFAKTADWLTTNYNAIVVVSVASDPVEKRIAEEICNSSKHKLINLADTPLTLGELKVLVSNADLVISNDTGPRHIAIALRRKIITLFGPNDPAWTDTGYSNEIQLIADVPCAPCAKPTCPKSEHLCMQAITVDMVCNAAKALLQNNRRPVILQAKREFTEISESFFVDSDYNAAFSKLGLTSIDAVFSFNAGRSLVKDNLPRFRNRLQFELNKPGLPDPTTVFLKRYDSPPIITQLKNWLSARSRTSCGVLDFKIANSLSKLGINTPRTLAYGRQRGILFEKKSFVITEKIPDADSLERRLPECFTAPPTPENLKLQRDFIAQLAAFVKKFHSTDFRHRDLYFSHIFHSDDGPFYLIDLARTFKPLLLKERFRLKDISQLYYSAPAKYFSRTDRLRFYLTYTGTKKLSKNDKRFINKLFKKAARMARHDTKHARPVPFASPAE